MMQSSPVSKFLLFPKIANFKSSIAFSYSFPLLVYVTAFATSALPWAADAPTQSLYFFALGTFIFWLPRLSASAFLTRDTSALRCPARAQRSLVCNLIGWAALTTIPATVWLIAHGIAPTSAIVVMVSALCFGACLWMIPRLLNMAAIGVFMLYVFGRLTVFESLGLGVLGIADVLIAIGGCRSWQSIVAGDQWLASFGPAVIGDHRNQKTRGSVPSFSNLSQRIWNRPIRREDRMSPIRAIATALGPEFVLKGRFGVANLSLVAITLVLWISAAIWFIPAAPGHDALRGLHGELSALSGTPVAMAVAFILFYPMTTLAALWRRWRAPAQDLALLALQPGLGRRRKTSLYLILAATGSTLWLIYMAALNLGIACALIIGWPAAVTIAATAIGTALMFVCLALALMAGCLPRILVALRRLIVAVLIFAICVAYLNSVSGNGFVTPTSWAVTAICMLVLVFIGTIGLGGYAFMRLLRQPHPFLAHR